MGNDEVTMGQDFLSGFVPNRTEDGENDVMLIYAEKNIGIYLAETYELLKRAVFYASRTLSPSAFKVYYCFDAHSGFSYPGRINSKKVAELCEIHIDTFYKARKELIASGLVYKIPKHRATDPDRIYVSNVLHERVVKEKNLNDVVKENFSNEISHVIQSGGSQPRTKALNTSVINEPPKVYHSSYSSLLPLQKESDVDVGNDTHATHDREAFERAFEPSQTVGYINAIQGVQAPFKLTPPKVKGQAKRLSKKQRLNSPVPSGFLNRLIDFCYNINTPNRRGLLDKVIVGRCSDALTKLIGAGADLTQFDDFVKEWRDLGWTKTPSPEMVVRNWFKVLNDDPEIDNVIETNTRAARAQEQAQDIDAFMLERAERIRRGEQ